MRTCMGVVAVAFGVACAMGASAQPEVRARSSVLVGGVTHHVVIRGETLTSIGARAGVDPETLQADNHLADASLSVGQTLRIDNRHVVPPGLVPGSLLVNVPQRMLFRADEDGVSGIPVAVGRTDWQTPSDPFTVVNRRTNPAWNVPASIREAARRAGRDLPPVVPPGPDNPLGQYWLGLDVGGIGIHGTNAPSSIYRVATHGCIRLHPDDIGWLYSRASIGTTGEIVYEPVLLAATADEVFLEVHRDVYRRAARDPRDEARRLAAAAGVTGRIDWETVDAVVAARHGVARPVGLRPVTGGPE